MLFKGVSTTRDPGSDCNGKASLRETCSFRWVGRDKVVVHSNCIVVELFIMQFLILSIVSVCLCSFVIMTLNEEKLLIDFDNLTIASRHFENKVCVQVSPISKHLCFHCRMDDHDRISQASSVATISYFPVIEVWFTSPWINYVHISNI